VSAEVDVNASVKICVLPYVEANMLVDVSGVIAVSGPSALTVALSVVLLARADTLVLEVAVEIEVVEVACVVLTVELVAMVLLKEVLLVGVMDTPVLELAVEAEVVDVADVMLNVDIVESVLLVTLLVEEVSVDVAQVVPSCGSMLMLRSW